MVATRDISALGTGSNIISHLHFVVFYIKVKPYPVQTIVIYYTLGSRKTFVEENVYFWGMRWQIEDKILEEDTKTIFI
jgi:hypothetical protein